jgi:hypothetical protein
MLRWISILGGLLIMMGHHALSLVKTSRTHKINDLATSDWHPSITILAMIALLRQLIGWIVATFLSREDLILENMALRQQLLALHTKRPRRRLSAAHKLFWVALRRLWSGWKGSVILVTPRTVVAWHRAGFRMFGNGFHERGGGEAERA